MSDVSFQNVRIDLQAPGAWIVINRPEKRNALDRRTILEIDSAVAMSLADPAIRVLVLTGSGDKAFVAGADIEEMSRMSPAEAQSFSRSFQECLDRIERAGKPVLAAVNGFALGGGCELALACHMRIASDTARFGQPEVSLGLIPGAGGTQRLSRLIGRGRALEWILLGEMVDAAEAYRVGVVNRVVAASALEQEVRGWVDRLSARSPLALARSIEAVQSGSETTLAEGLRLEAALFGLSFATEDMREGTRAFLEKRKASFPGR